MVRATSQNRYVYLSEKLLDFIVVLHAQVTVGGITFDPSPYLEKLLKLKAIPHSKDFFEASYSMLLEKINAVTGR